jgi:hypothetical protein
MTTGGGTRLGASLFWEKIFAFTWQALWIMPNEKIEGGWIIVGAMITLLIPFFFASWLLEYWVSLPFLSRAIHLQMNGVDSDSIYTEIRSAWLTANLLSYGILFGLLVVTLLITLIC